jgi:hypothetical protein
MAHPFRNTAILLWTLVASGCVSVERIDANEARIADLERRLDQSIRAAEEAKRQAAEALELVEGAEADAVTANVRASEAALIAEKAVEIAEGAQRAAETALVEAKRRAQ